MTCEGEHRSAHDRPLSLSLSLSQSSPATRHANKPLAPAARWWPMRPGPMRTRVGARSMTQARVRWVHAHACTSTSTCVHNYTHGICAENGRGNFRLLFGILRSKIPLHSKTIYGDHYHYGEHTCCHRERSSY